MPKITPHLWFDREARAAAGFYASLFPDSRISNITTLHGTPAGDCDVVSFELSGQPFMAISAGPPFRFNPSVSFIVNFDPARDRQARANLDDLWAKLSRGTALMPLDTYFFSERYGWIQDAFGLSWQLILSDPEGEERPVIVPALLFAGKVCGRAEEAIDFYTSVFENSRRGMVARYGADQAPDREGTIMSADFMLAGTWFAAMDSAHPHDFAFNEAISFMVSCDTQEEIDYHWAKLSADPAAEQCGWLRDRYGLSWQIVPAVMAEMIRAGDQAKTARLTAAFLKMKKFDIAALSRAYEGK